ncbi:hypothetical protein AB832_03570 [Flavobacteriaceae bacterium (ex Bugula neritina AB1)]|nr:hypothetical protein AB832_03570 [Flavobacteriaceae bacterium (ex Bugula neritina AB1)]
MIQEAIKLHNLGLKVIPTGINKRPSVKWKQYQEYQTKEDIQQLFNNSTESMALLTGNGIEVIDIDTKYFLEHHRIEDVWDLILSAVGEEKYMNLLITQTQSGGYHVIYKTDVSAGNQKLASRYTIEEERKNEHDLVRVLLETRGEGGYIIIPPSKGYTFDSSLDFSRIPTLSDHQRNALIAACMTFDETEESFTQNKAPTPVKISGSGKSTIEAFNESHTPLELLEESGWERAHTRGGNIHLVRPGKTVRQGIGAGYSEKLNLVRIFTSSTQFEPEKSYNAFQVYSVLNHGGDYSAACKALYKAGFGEILSKTKDSHREKVSQITSLDSDIADKASNTDLMKSIYEGRLDITVKPVQKPNSLFLYCDETKEYRGLGGDGDLVNIFGREKTRKSAIASCAASCFIENSEHQNKSLNFKVDFDGRNLLHFDTEQSKYHHHKLATEMLYQQGLSPFYHPKNFFSFSIMPYTKIDRLNFLRYAIDNTPNIGCVFVDGIVDLCRNYNDLEESSDLVTFFMNMASSRGFLLLDVLHNARSTGDARGHLGTELLNKATCNINIIREEDANCSTLKIKNMRGREPVGFDFWHDENGHIEKYD